MWEDFFSDLKKEVKTVFAGLDFGLKIREMPFSAAVSTITLSLKRNSRVSSSIFSSSRMTHHLVRPPE